MGQMDTLAYTTDGVTADSGMSPSFVDVYIQGHRGSNPQNPDELCDEGATQRLAAYGQEMTARHGQDFDWRAAPIDPVALYHSGQGLKHDRWAMGHGVVGFDRPGGSSSSGSIRREETRRAQEEARKAQEEARLAREEARLAREAARRSEEHADYMNMFLQQLTQALGPTLGANMPLWRPPVMPPHQGATQTPPPYMFPTQYMQYPQGQAPQGQATQVFHGPLIHPYMSTDQSIVNYGMYQTPLVQQMPPHTSPTPQDPASGGDASAQRMVDAFFDQPCDGASGDSNSPY